MQVATWDGIAGRDPELAAVAEAVAGVSRGRGSVVWIGGMAGIGKTALVDAIVTAAAEVGCRTMRGAGDELTAAFPLRMMADCLGVSPRSADPDAAALARLLWGERGQPGAPDPVRTAADRLLERARQLGRDGAVLIAADDLHWADQQSVDLWHRLADLTIELPLVLVGAARQAPGTTLADALRNRVRGLGGVSLDLGPLSEDAAMEVAARHLGARPGPRLRAELRRAGGHPLLVRELASGLLGHGAITVADGAAEFQGEAGMMPGPLALRIERRLGLGALSMDGTLVRIAALLDDGCGASDLAAVTGRPRSAVTDVMAEAAAVGILASDEEFITFRHELVRQALASQIPAAVTRTVHQHIARRLARGRVDVVARHLLAGPDVLDDWTLQWLAARADVALHAVPHAAVGLLAIAVRSLDEHDPRWETFAGLLAHSSFLVGCDEEVVRLATVVAERTGDVGRAVQMKILVMRSAARLGRFGDAVAAAESALGRGDLAPPWRARLCAWLTVLLAIPGQRTRTAALAAEAMREARRSRDLPALALAHLAASFCCGTAEAIEHTDMALELLGSDAESIDLRLFLRRHWLLLLARTDRADDLERALEEALREAGQGGTIHSVAILGAAAQVRYRQGDWDRALEYLARIEPAFREYSDAIRLNGLATLISLRRGGRAGDYPSTPPHAAPADLAGAGLSAAADLVTPYRNDLIGGAALAAEVDGDLSQALTLATRWLDGPDEGRSYLAGEDAPTLVRLALETGARDVARAVVAAIEADAVADPVAGRVLSARCCRAQLDNDPEALLAVAGECLPSGRPLLNALALEEAAVRLAERGDRSRARTTLAEAVRAYDGPGATRDVRRADARLRRHGVRRGPKSSHRRQDVGWESLTPAETRVALLFAQGLSNNDIANQLMLSRRTVQVHVSRIRAKLQLGSRAELARLMAARAR